MTQPSLLPGAAAAAAATSLLQQLRECTDVPDEEKAFQISNLRQTCSDHIRHLRRKIAHANSLDTCPPDGH